MVGIQIPLGPTLLVITYMLTVALSAKDAFWLSAVPPSASWSWKTVRQRSGQAESGTGPLELGMKTQQDSHWMYSGAHFDMTVHPSADMKLIALLN